MSEQERAEALVAGAIIFVVLMFMLMAFDFLFLSSTKFDDISMRRDSQGVPCTISDARRADGTLECK